MNVLEVAKEINKSYKDKDLAIFGGVLPKVEKLSSGSLGFDYCTYSGIPYGSIVSISGVFSSGKSLASALLMARYQEENPGKTCVYVDVENTLPTQLDFMKRMTGLKTDEESLVILSPHGYSAEDVLAMILDFQRGSDNIGMIILDSVAALVSMSDLENDFEKDNGLRATTAKTIRKFLKAINPEVARKGNILILINQVMVDQTLYNGAKIYKEPCGSAVEFFPHVRIRFGTRTFTREDKTDISPSKPEEADGIRLKFAIIKSKVDPLDRGGGFITFRYDTGVDKIHDTLEIATKYNLIKKLSSVTYLLTNLETGKAYTDKEGNELKFTGRPKLIQYMKEHPDFCNEYVNMLNKYISNLGSKSLLDDDDLAEILRDEDNTR